MSQSRQKQSFEVRVAAAKLALRRPDPKQTPRGDDTKTKIGSYTKGLPHVPETGIISKYSDFHDFVKAIDSGDVQEIADLQLGPRGPKNKRFISGISCGDGVKVGLPKVRAWESMSAGNAFDLEGPDAQSVAMPPHPALDSAELIAEMTEVYWMSLIRDIPFINFDKNQKVKQAVKDMNETDWIRFSKNPPKNLSPDEENRLRDPVTPDTIFRGVLRGDNDGPYLSQFLIAGTGGIGGEGKPEDGFITYGAHRIDQRVRFAEPRRDYMTTWASWLDVQNAADVTGREVYRPGFRFIATPRDLATYVHFDALYQAYLNTCISLLALEAPFDDGIPFTDKDEIDNQQGFALWGGPHILTLVTEVATRALKAVRFQKFNTHLRPRPERLAGLIERFHNEPQNKLFAPIKTLYKGLDDDLLKKVAQENARQNRELEDFGNPRSEDFDPTGKTGANRLLPMAFPEGSPMHPSYGAGHATVAGACVTILKAWFNTDWKLPFAFETSADGSRLIPYKGRPLKLGGELNKICSNVSIGRNWAGVHYFTDYIESIKIGEEIAIGILEEQLLTYQEKVSMTFTKFCETKPTTISNRH